MGSGGLPLHAKGQQPVPGRLLYSQADQLPHVLLRVLPVRVRHEQAYARGRTEWVEDLAEVSAVEAIDPEAKGYILEVDLDYP